MRVICLTMFFSFSENSFVSSFTKSVLFLALKKKLSLSQKPQFFHQQFTHKSHNTKFSPLFLSFDEDRLHNTEENRSSLLLSHYTRYTHTNISLDMSSPNVPSPPPSDPFAPNPPPVPGILITKVRFPNRFLKRERKRDD